MAHTERQQLATFQIKMTTFRVMVETNQARNVEIFNRISCTWRKISRREIQTVAMIFPPFAEWIRNLTTYLDPKPTKAEKTK